MLLRSFAAICGAVIVLMSGAPAASQATATPAETAFRQKDYATALSLGRQECEAKRLEGCVVVAVVLNNGLGVARDVPGARAVLGRACDLQSAGGCLNLAYTWMGKEGRDYAQARPFLEKACALGSSDGCANLGVLQVQGLTGPPDRAAGVATMRRACDLGSRSGCASLGLTLADAKAAGGADYSGAAKALLKACDLGDAQSCHPAGTLLLSGRGVPPDSAASFRAIGAACAAGGEQACVDLRRLGGAFPEAIATPAAIRAIYEKACLSPKQVNCLAASLAVAEGAATPEAFTAAAALADKACAPSKPGPKACRARDLMKTISADLSACLAAAGGCGRMSSAVVRLVDEFRDIDSANTLALPGRHAKGACDWGDLEGCAALGWIWAFNNSTASVDTVLPSAIRACAGRKALGCEFVGWVTLIRFDEQLNAIRDKGDHYQDTDVDWQRLYGAWENARTAIATGCASGWAEGCIALAIRQPMMEPGRAPSEDAIRAACNSTWASRCYETASVLLAARFQRGEYKGTLDGKFGCAVDDAVCRAVGRWYGGQKGSSPNSAFGKGTFAALGLAMMDQACTRGSADACVFMGLYHTPSDAGALAERQVNWPLAAGYARKILSLDPSNRYGKDLAKRSAERGL